MIKMFIRFNLNTIVSETRFITFEDDRDTGMNKNILEITNRIDMGTTRSCFVSQMWQYLEN